MLSVQNDGDRLASFRSVVAGDSGPAAHPKAEESSTKCTSINSKPTLSQPTGVLGIHIKQIRLQSWDLETLFTGPEISVYMRLQIAGNVKFTCAYDHVTFPAILNMDDLKHFHLQISPNRTDDNNNLRLELVGFEGTETHHVIARKDIHLYDIIKNLYAVDTYKMRRVEKLVAETEVEFCFTYGCFGYGYSNQLENRRKVPKEQISHTMFCRLAPPSDRQHEEVAADVMSSLPFGHPIFIPFTEKAIIKDMAHECGSEIDMALIRSYEEPSLLVANIRKRMHRLQTAFAKENSRKSRLRFLRNLVCHSDMVTQAQDEFKVRRHFHLKRRNLHVNQRDTTWVPPVAVEETEGDDGEQDLEDAVKVLELAPGVQGRRTSNQNDRKWKRGTGKQISVMQKLFGDRGLGTASVSPHPMSVLDETKDATTSEVVEGEENRKCVPHSDGQGSTDTGALGPPPQNQEGSTQHSFPESGATGGRRSTLGSTRDAPKASDQSGKTERKSIVGRALQALGEFAAIRSSKKRPSVSSQPRIMVNPGTPSASSDESNNSVEYAEEL